MQEGPVRAVALPPSPTAAALARLRTRAFAPIPLALPRPFASVWLRLRAGRSRGAARRVAPRSRIPARRVAPPLPQGCRVPARHVASPSPASSPTPRDRLQHAAPQRPFMFACPRFLATGSPLPHAARFPLHVRALAISGQQSEFWHESAPFRRRIGPADSADLGFRRGGAPSSGEGARPRASSTRKRMFSRTEGGRRPAQPERRTAAQPARAGGGGAGARGGHAGGAAGRGGHAADARGGTENPRLRQVAQKA